MASSESQQVGGGRFALALVVALAVALLTGCATPPGEIDRPTSQAFLDTEDTQLGRSVRDKVRLHPDRSGFLLLRNGLDAFAARVVLAEAAQRSIDAQYYLLNDDRIGALFIDSLVKAADRGVRVRLLVDDMDLAGRTLGAAVLDSHPNVEVRLFNPFHRGVSRTVQLFTRFGSVTRRMHNKSFTVDNQLAILGGRNIGDQYFDTDPEVGFTDLDVLMIGSVVKEVSESFDRYWNSELAYPAMALLGREPNADEFRQKYGRLRAVLDEEVDGAYLKALHDSELAHRIRDDKVTFEWGPAHVVFDVPDKLLTPRSEKRYHLAPKLKPYFEGVRNELVIVSPYFVPGRAGTAFLTDLAQRGVQVRVITNSLSSTDVPIVHAGYAKYRRALLGAGVELFEFKSEVTGERGSGGSGFAGASSASLHSKAFLFDRRHFFIGSMNLDPRSAHENTEIGVIFTSPTLGEQVSRNDENVLERVAFRLEPASGADGSAGIIWYEEFETGQPARVHHVDPDTSFWERFWTSLVGLLPIESQL